MFKLLDKYDKLPEPRRFFTFFIPFATYVMVTQTLPQVIYGFQTLKAMRWQMGLMLPLILVIGIRMMHLNLRRKS